jgi:hypothetical protein
LAESPGFAVTTDQLMTETMGTATVVTVSKCGSEVVWVKLCQLGWLAGTNMIHFGILRTLSHVLAPAYSYIL